MQKIKLSIRVGGEYRVRDVGLAQWRKLAQQVRFDEGRLIDRLVEMAEQLPDAVSAVRKSARHDGLSQPVVERLEQRIIERAAECRKTLAGSCT
jgi:serine/threonine-protein kinase HipA